MVRTVVAVCLLGLLAAPTVVAAQPAGRTSERTGVAPRPGAEPSHDVATGARRLPGGFNDSLVRRVAQPTGLAWTPDGRMLVISKLGRLVVVRDGERKQVALDLRSRLCTADELGLLGIAVDPNFAANHFVYLYYSRDRGGACGGPGARQPVNRVGRFVLSNADVAAEASEKVVVDNIIAAGAHHVGGDLEFGADGFLYVTVGDGVCGVRSGPCGGLNPNAQDLSVPQGKILRVTRRGAPAAGNPYTAVDGARRCTAPGGIPRGTGPCREIFASGFRNPFRFARKPGTSTFFVNDVGEQTWEEVDRLSKGRNYGWNKREGFCARGSTSDCSPVRRFTDPLFAYPHQRNCRSVTGGAFVPDGLWPGFDGAYVFADYACGKLWRLDRQPDGSYRRTLFSSGLSGPTHLRFGPAGDRQALYYVSIFAGEVRRIVTRTGNTAPTAAFGYRPDGTTLAFDGSASTDGDQGDRVTTWVWDFGDGSPVVETTTPEVSHTYADDAVGERTVTLTVEDREGLASAPVTRRVLVGEHAPTISFTSPAPDAVFRVGQSFSVTAEATDTEDGPIPPENITWLVKRQHDNHVHPFLGPVKGASVDGVYPEAESLAAAAGSRLVVEVSAVDSRGLTTRATRTLEPRRVALSFRTRPRGGTLLLEGEEVVARHDVVSWVGHTFRARVPDQRIDGERYVFERWLDSTERVRDIVSPAEPTSYVAIFRRP